MSELVIDALDTSTLLNTLVAFKDGDFSVRLPVDQTGVAGKIADTLNEIFRLNERMAREFARISSAVGKEGKINQRASLGRASGDWAECLESVNALIGDLVQPSTEMARVIGSVARGDLSQTMALDVDGRSLKGEFLHTARVFNAMVADIGQRKKTEEQIRQLNTSLEERVLERTEALLRSNEELEQFAYIASHDLQEPLREVSIYAQLLAERFRGQLNGSADQYIGVIVEGSRRMERLISDLLDFSRVEARGADFFASMNSDEAFEDALRIIHSLIAETGAVITREGLPRMTADPIQITRLFQNLVVNSIKYRSSERPRIHVAAEPIGNDWLFSVRDNGIGIDPQYLEKVFGIFKCLDPRDRRSGSGMGLAICRKIVSRHRGRIWVESTLGQGATFLFTLPR